MGKGHKAGRQVGKGQTISAIRNEHRGYERFGNTKDKLPPKVYTLPPGHTPFSWMHSPEMYPNFEPNWSPRNAKRNHQAGRGARKSAAVKAPKKHHP
jgi:hypothetical protein